jgi:hypothetical protein
MQHHQQQQQQPDRSCLLPISAVTAAAYLFVLDLTEHYADELEMELADALLEEFHVEVEDGSPSQVRSTTHVKGVTTS